MIPAASMRFKSGVILIASELVINALKYAFVEQGGTIMVSLITAEDFAELVVEDDGAGMGVAAKPGSGSCILDEFAVLLRVPVARSGGADGGLRISLLPPIHLG